MPNRPIGKPIETKLHVIELSLLPPNSQGIMPAGIQRFPFEFPLPGSLPTTISIPDRLDIFYRLTATIRRRSSSEDPSWSSSFLDWAARLGKKQKLVATANLRLVRAIEPIPSLTTSFSVPPPEAEEQRPALRTTTSEGLNDGTSSDPLDRRTSLDRYYAIDHDHDEPPSNNNNSLLHGLALDEQHDRLAYSMAGRTIDNYGRPAQDLEYGVRYRMSIDRTAIAIGTSLGVEVMLEPLTENIRIRSITAKICETRDYTMKVPGDYGGVKGQPETLKTSETVGMVLKWAYGYPTEHDASSSSSGEGKQQKGKAPVQVLSRRYRHRRCSWVDSADDRRKFQGEAQEGHPSGDMLIEEEEEDDGSWSDGELVNLKNLGQPVQVGEYFEGRFVMPVPTCDHLLHPSMMHEKSITIRHWLELAVSLEYNKTKLFKITLASPVRMLDCRLVDQKILLPPPPSYNATASSSSSSSSAAATANSTTFWVQRWHITQDAMWGACDHPCPCQIKRLNKKKKFSATPSSGSGTPGNNTTPPLPCMQPEWGPPPQYSEI